MNNGEDFDQFPEEWFDDIDEMDLNFSGNIVFLANFDRHKTPIYMQACAIYNDMVGKEVMVVDKACTSMKSTGFNYDSLYGLYTTGEFEMKTFWDLFDKIKHQRFKKINDSNWVCDFLKDEEFIVKTIVANMPEYEIVEPRNYYDGFSMGVKYNGAATIFFRSEFFNMYDKVKKEIGR